MKKLYFILIFVFMSSTAFAEQGQIKQTGFFSGTSKVIGDDKGNFSIIYEGTIGNKAIEGTTFGDRSSSYCVGSIVGLKGKGFETGVCINKFEDGSTTTTHYEGVMGKILRWKFVSGTGKYENISGGGTTSYTQIDSAKDGVVQSYNQIVGTYNLN